MNPGLSLVLRAKSYRKHFGLMLFASRCFSSNDRVIDINVRGTFVTTLAALKYMNEGGPLLHDGAHAE